MRASCIETIHLPFPLRSYAKNSVHTFPKKTQMYTLVSCLHTFYNALMDKAKDESKGKKLPDNAKKKKAPPPNAGQVVHAVMKQLNS